MELNNKINFWQERAKEDFAFAERLFKDKNYLWCLFALHLSLEKTLKARILEKIQKEAPFIHDLVRLAKLAGFVLQEKDIGNLRTFTGFNIEARYEDYRQRLKKIATARYTQKYLAVGRKYLIWFLKKN